MPLGSVHPFLFCGDCQQKWQLQGWFVTQIIAHWELTFRNEPLISIFIPTIEILSSMNHHKETEVSLRCMILNTFFAVRGEVVMYFVANLEQVSKRSLGRICSSSLLYNHGNKAW